MFFFPAPAIRQKLKKIHYSGYMNSPSPGSMLNYVRY